MNQYLTAQVDAKSDDEFSGWVRRQVDAWSAHRSLAELVAMFGGVFPPGGGLETRLAFLDEFSAVWDYRGQARARGGGRVHCQDAAGAARWLIPHLNLPTGQLETISTLAQQLGFTTESRPQGRAFDYLLVIGTGRYSNLLRTRWARELATDRRIGEIVLAAASRRLLQSEDDAVAACAPGARTEFQLLAAAAEAFGLDTRQAVQHAREMGDNPPRDGLIWRFAAGTNDLGVPITLLEAPSPDPDHRRATSADTFTFTARTLGMHRFTCLLVTGQPFVLYQNFDALRTLTLPFGIRVETVGFGIDRYNGLGELDRQHPAKLLQEVRSTIRAARALLERIAPRERRPGHRSVPDGYASGCSSAVMGHGTTGR